MLSSAKPQPSPAQSRWKVSCPKLGLFFVQSVIVVCPIFCSDLVKANFKPINSQAKTGQTKPDQTKPDQARPSQTRPDQTRPDQTRPVHTVQYKPKVA